MLSPSAGAGRHPQPVSAAMPHDASQTPAPRAAWVDAARSGAMFFIIWLHAGAAPAWCGQAVGAALFLFFLLAGYFSAPAEGVAPSPRPCLQRGLKLGLAWLLWSLLAAGLYALFSPEHTLTWQRLLGWGEPAYNTPLWFLRSLAVYELLLAALTALRLLPRFKWLVLLLLLCYPYADTPAQHLTLRFDYFPVLLLGYGLRSLALPRLQELLQRRALPLGGVCLLLLLLPAFSPRCAAVAALCPLPANAAAIALLILLAASTAQRLLPRVTACLAQAGQGMMFCYVTHSFFLAPLYMGYEVQWAQNIWVPLLLLPLLTVWGARCRRRYPRAMRLLLAR